MPDIRYVCLSDLHLGADNSVLTPIKPGSIDIETGVTGAVLTEFVACLRAVIAQNVGKEKPRLILNGDILEMALADTNQAAMVFEHFINLIFPPDGEALFDTHLLYNPGNHDHHVWESARETQYINYMARIPANAPLDAPWHTTKMVTPDFVPERLMTTLLRRHPHLQDATVEVVYPNYAMFSEDGQRCVLITHGHYIESIYSLMSTLNTMIFPDRKKPTTIYEVEAENFAWIDFFWSTMGRSGDVGRDIGILYDKLQDKQQVDKLLESFSSSLVEKWHHWKILEGVEAKALTWLIETIMNKSANLESRRPEQLLSPDAQQGLKWYMEEPMLGQLRVEHQQALPTDLTLLFGHTHKPFEQAMSFAGYPAPIKVYNSGGWVADHLHPTPIFGAAALLLDENLQTTSLRLYNQAATPQEYVVRVEEASGGASANPFHERIKGLVQPGSDPWKSFSAAVAEEVRIHEQVLQTKINLWP